MLGFVLLGFALLLISLNVLGIVLERPVVRFVVRPLFHIVLMVWALTASGVWAGVGLREEEIWLLRGLFLAGVGDVFLMLPRERFNFGLAAFLGMQLCYIKMFVIWPLDDYMVKPMIVLALVLSPMFLLLFQRLVRGIRESNRSRMVWPVLIYGLALAAMVYFAIFSGFIDRLNPPLPTFIVAGGALAFLYSDLTLAWHRFVTAIQNAELKVQLSYQVAQFLIAVGIILYVS